MCLLIYFHSHTQPSMYIGCKSQKHYFHFQNKPYCNMFRSLNLTPNLQLVCLWVYFWNVYSCWCLRRASGGIAQTVIEGKEGEGIDSIL